MRTLAGVDFVLAQFVRPTTGFQPMTEWLPPNKNYTGSFFLLRVACILAWEKQINSLEGVISWFQFRKPNNPSLADDMKKELKQHMRKKLAQVFKLFESHRKKVGRGAPAVLKSKSDDGNFNYWSYTDDRMP